MSEETLEETFMRTFAHMSPDAEAWRLPTDSDEILVTEDGDPIVTEDDDFLLI